MRSLLTLPAVRTETDEIVLTDPDFTNVSIGANGTQRAETTIEVGTRWPFESWVGVLVGTFITGWTCGLAIALWHLPQIVLMQELARIALFA